jgi:hypothetical protein
MAANTIFIGVLAYFALDFLVIDNYHFEIHFDKSVTSPAQDKQRLKVIQVSPLHGYYFVVYYCCDYLQLITYLTNQHFKQDPD